MSKDLKSIAVRLTFSPQVELGYQAMYPTLRSGMINAINAWPELLYSSLQEIKGLFDINSLTLMAEVVQGKDYDVIAMLDGSYIIKSLNTLDKYKRVENLASLKRNIEDMTSAQRLALCDWCYRYNKMPDNQKDLIANLIIKNA